MNHPKNNKIIKNEKVPAQMELFPREKIKFIFGGSSTVGRRKVARTILPNKWVHLCLKSKKATGSYSMLHPRLRFKIQNLIRQKAKKFAVELNDAVNMGNHIHIKLRVKRKSDFIKFNRSITGLIARMVTGAKKGCKFGKFWDAIAFTRVLKTKYEELSLKAYFKANRIEREKGYQARTVFLDHFNMWLKGLKKLTSTA